MHPYYDMLRDIIEHGEDRGDRTGVGTRSIFGYQARYHNIGENFPLDTSRELRFESIVHELLWMLRGETNIRSLVQHGVNIWTDWPYKRYCQIVEKRIREGETNLITPSRAEFNERIRTDNAFAKKYGDCGPVYGKQWRNWYAGFQIHPFHWPTEKPYEMFEEKHAIEGEIQESDTQPVYVDQIANLVEDLKKNPLSRRHIVSAWNVADIPAMIPSGLPPCHVMFQFYCSHLTFEQRCKEAEKVAVRTEDMRDDMNWEARINKNNIPKYRLHCQLYQRSLDSVLGAPYNIASYSLLMMMLAQQCNMVPGGFIHTIGDAHIYHNHREKLEHQLNRRPMHPPTVEIRKAKDIFSYTIDDFTLSGYEPHPAIHYPIAV